MSCNCGKPKCDGKCGISPSVLQINNPGDCTLFHRVEVPASMGDSKTNPPKNGDYRNVLLYYVADGTSWLFSSDGTPQKLVNGFTNYEDAINLPQINGETLIGNKNSADLKLADAPMVITIASGNVRWYGADTAEDIYNFFLDQGKVNVVFEGSENYGYEIVSAAYIPGEQKMMCMTTVASVDTGSSPVEFSNSALYGLMTFYTADKAVDVGELDLQPKLFITDFTGLELNDNVLSGVPATNANIGMVKPGDGLEVAQDGTLSISDIEQYAHFFDTVADMQDATNLINGSYAKTLGFHAKNDGGEAVYKIRNITNDDVIDGASIIEINNSGNQLVAELILTDPINVKTFGAYGDDTHDDTQAIQKAINYGFSKGLYTVFLPNGTYKTTDPIYLLEKCEIRGENNSDSIIHKTANGTGSVSGINADAIIILTDSTYDTGTTVSTDKRNMEKINNLKLTGNISSYTSGKSDAQKQYGIWCIGYAPKTAIDNISISGVDVGIEAKGMYVSHISDIFGLHAFYAGIKITVESQGIIVSNINTLATHDVGIMLCGATYGSMQACLVEWTYGGYAYRFSNWHGEMNGCGYELGDGPHVGISAVDSKISLVGGYFYSGSPNESNNAMISLSGSSFTLRDSVIGTYNQTIQYNGKFFNLYNSNIVIDETNKFFGSFAEDSVGSGTAFCTINGKTYDVLRDSVLLASGPTNAGDKYDYIDSDFNSTKKHPRVNIYTGNVSNPFTNDVVGRNDWGPAYNKGDIGFYKNAYATGKLGWFCNRDNHSDLAESAGTISAVAENSITLTDPFTVDFSTTGTRFFVNCKIKGVTSEATARISWISNDQFGITEKTGTFQVGEKIKMESENFWVYADYLPIPLILAGTSMYRPSTSVSIGTMYFDTTLNKPIWYKGSNTWVDATGATV